MKNLTKIHGSAYPSYCMLMNALQGIFSYFCNKLHLKNHQCNRLENMHLFSHSGMFSQLHYAVLRCVMAQISNWVWIFSSGLYNLLEAAPAWRCSSIAVPGTKSDEQSPFCFLRPQAIYGTILLPPHSIGGNQSQTLSLCGRDVLKPSAY